MLNKDDIRQYRMLRGLSYREVSNYCNVTHTLISQIEKGERGLTLETHNEIVNGINLAYDAKCKGTLKAENTKKPKTDTVKQLTENLAQALDKDTQTEVKPKKTTKTRKSTKTKKSEQENENVCSESACDNQTDVVE